MTVIKINIDGAVQSTSAKVDTKFVVVGGTLYVRNNLKSVIAASDRYLKQALSRISDYNKLSKSVLVLEKKRDALDKGTPAYKRVAEKCKIVKDQAATSKRGAISSMAMVRSGVLVPAGISGLVLPFTSADIKSGNTKALKKKAIGTYSVKGDKKFYKPKYVSFDKLMRLIGVDPEAEREKDRREYKRERDAERAERKAKK